MQYSNDTTELSRASFRELLALERDYTPPSNIYHEAALRGIRAELEEREEYKNEEIIKDLKEEVSELEEQLRDEQGKNDSIDYLEEDKDSLVIFLEDLKYEIDGLLARDSKMGELDMIGDSLTQMSQDILETIKQYK